MGRVNNILICDYCGKEKDKIIFVIGASRKPDWVMNEGTGKISCPDCFAIGRAEGNLAIQKHIEQVNSHVKQVNKQ